MNTRKHQSITPAILCLTALCAVVNLVGGSIALLLRLPIYLDSIGTMLAAALLGPFYGMLPGLASGLISGFTSDIYALYYIPVQLITGFLTGIVFRHASVKGFRLIPFAALISLPATVVSSLITAAVFGGVTSSGSTIFVQLLQHAGLSMTASVCLVQVFTDYADRIIALFLTVAVLAAMPASLKALGQQRRKEDIHGTLS